MKEIPLCFDGLLWPWCDRVVATFLQTKCPHSRHLLWLQHSIVSLQILTDLWLKKTVKLIRVNWQSLNMSHKVTKNLGISSLTTKKNTHSQNFRIILNIVSGWWFGTFFYFSIQLGISSSQLLLTPSFFRGVGIPPTSTNQIIINHH